MYVFTFIDSSDKINAIYCLEFKISFQSHFQQTLQNSICNKMKSWQCLKLKTEMQFISPHSCAVVKFSSGQRNMIKTYQNKADTTTLITKITLNFFSTAKITKLQLSNSKIAKLSYSIAQCLTWYYGYFLGYLHGSIQRFLPAAVWETLVSPNHTNENILRYRC